MVERTFHPAENLPAFTALLDELVRCGLCEYTVRDGADWDSPDVQELLWTIYLDPEQHKVDVVGPWWEKINPEFYARRKGSVYAQVSTLLTKEPTDA